MSGPYTDVDLGDAPGFDEREDAKADALAGRDPPICRECGGGGGNCPGCFDDQPEDDHDQ